MRPTLEVGVDYYHAMEDVRRTDTFTNVLRVMQHGCNTLQILFADSRESEYIQCRDIYSMIIKPVIREGD